MSKSKKGNVKCDKCGKSIKSECEAMTVDIIYPYDPKKISYGKYKRLDFCENCTPIFDSNLEMFIK